MLSDSLAGLTPLLFGLIVLVFILAGLVKGMVGLGLPTISMGLLVLMMPPAQAAALLIVPSLVTNIWQVRPWRTLGPLLRRLGPMQVGVCLGTWAGALILGAPSGIWASVALGVALIAYALWGLFGSAPRLPPHSERWAGPAAGVLTGLLTAATGVFVMPAVPYLQALKLERDELIQAMGISFSVSTLALGIGLWLNHSYTPSGAGISLFMLGPALAGMYLGQHLRDVLSPKVFRLCFFATLILLGLHLTVGEWLL